jgi:hypothetical protein
MASFTDRITRLAAKVEQYDTKIAELNEQREQALTEMQSLIGGGNVKTTTTSGTKAAKGSLGDKIVTFLQASPGQTRDDIASKLRVTPSKIGLSLYHLGTKHKVYKNEENKFYITESTGVQPAITV